MTAFRYVALKVNGARVSGEINAATASGAAAELQRLGLYPLKTQTISRGRVQSFVRGFAKPKTDRAALSIATHELASLLTAGLPLDRAIDTVAPIVSDKHLRTALTQIRERLRGGAPLADAIAMHPNIFPPLYVSMVTAGEATGGLATALHRLAEYLDRSQAIREQVRSAMVYPVILLSTAGLTLTFVLTTVLPQFKPLFASAGKTLPLSTRIVMGAGDLVTHGAWLIVLLTISAVILFRRALAQPVFRRSWDARLLRLPIVGRLIAEAEAGRFARTLGTLLQAGMTLPVALPLARDTVSNSAMAADIGRAANEIRAGEGLSTLLERSGLFPALAAQLVRVGEATGRLDEMLMHQAALFDRSVARAMDRWLAALVPGLTIVLGVLVAGIVGSVLAAVLQINYLAG